MELLLHIIEVYGLWVVFLCVLFDQGGLPVPSYPPIIVTAALAVDSGDSLWPILVVASFAAVLADLLWFAGGRRFGASLLRLMCKLSLSADSCVGLTRRIYGHWGPPSLIVSKYVPGFAAVATTLAGEAGISLRRFALYDGIGALLWAGGAVALGAIFHEAVGAVLLELDQLGRYALILLLAAVALFIAIKWWQRRRFSMKIRMARISPRELDALLRFGHLSPCSMCAAPNVVCNPDGSPEASMHATSTPPNYHSIPPLRWSSIATAPMTPRLPSLQQNSKPEASVRCIHSRAVLTRGARRDFRSLRSPWGPQLAPRGNWRRRRQT